MSVSAALRSLKNSTASSSNNRYSSTASHYRFSAEYDPGFPGRCSTTLRQEAMIPCYVFNKRHVKAPRFRPDDANRRVVGSAAVCGARTFGVRDLLNLGSISG